MKRSAHSRLFPMTTFIALGFIALTAAAGTPPSSPKIPSLSAPADEILDDPSLVNPAHPALKRVVKAEKLLIGTWRSVDLKENKAPPGSIFFQPNGAILIAPDGYRPLAGQWEANMAQIRFTTVEQGDALLGYTLSADRKLLTLTFDKGQVQTFFRQPTKKSH